MQRPEHLPLAQYLVNSDIGLSTALSTVGYVVKAIDKSNPLKAKFTFERDDEIDEIVALYWSNKLDVDARSFHENLRMLKYRARS